MHIYNMWPQLKYINLKFKIVLYVKDFSVENIAHNQEQWFDCMKQSLHQNMSCNVAIKNVQIVANLFGLLSFKALCYRI